MRMWEKRNNIKKEILTWELGGDVPPVGVGVVTRKLGVRVRVLRRLTSAATVHPHVCTNQRERERKKELIIY